MDGILININKIEKKFKRWLNAKLLTSQATSEYFYQDVHIDYFDRSYQWDRTFYSNPERDQFLKLRWWKDSFTILNAFNRIIGNTYDNLEIGICFELKKLPKNKSLIPKTFSLKNFSKKMIMPPEIMIFSSNYKQVLVGDKIYLYGISEKFKMEAYYVEKKDIDATWRWIYFIPACA